MTRARRWVVATGNAGKLAEIEALLRGSGLTLVAQGELGIDPAEETGLTFLENALIKARHAAARAGLPALADDSGLCVDALSGAPGVRSARYAGPGADDGGNIAKLLDALRDVPEDRRTARFHCVVVAVPAPEHPAPLLATGVWPGRIAAAPSGTSGFGYDPIFFDPALHLTAAELPAAVKNEVSHRATALRRLARKLRTGRVD